MSPIVAISHSEDIKLKQNKLKTPKFVKKCFGEGGIIAYKNMKRNKRKYRVVVISIVVSMTVFIAMNSFVGLMINSANYYAEDNRFDLSVYLLSVKQEEQGSYYSQIKNDINSVTNITRYSLVKNLYVGFNEKPKFTDEYKKWINDDEDSGYYISLVSVGDEEYNEYIKQLGLDKEKVKNGGILYNKFNAYSYDENGKETQEYLDIYKYGVSDKISYTIEIGREDAELQDIEIVAVTDELPFAISKNLSNGVLIVSDEYMNKYDEYIRSVNMCINCDDADKAQEVLVNNYSIDNSQIFNRSASKRENQSLIMMVSIFLYGFIVVVSLIGITNIFNTITTFIELRNREFAMLRCVGMTKREFNRMVALESLFYGGKAGIIGILLGTGLSYLIYQYMAETVIKYNIPFLAIGISLLAVCVLLLSITKYSLKQMDKKNIIETLRNENV